MKIEDMTDTQFEAHLKRKKITGMAAFVASRQRKAKRREIAAANPLPVVESHSGQPQLQPINALHLAQNFADYLAKENGWEEPGDYAQCEENAQQLVAFMRKQYPKHIV